LLVEKATLGGIVAPMSDPVAEQLARNLRRLREGRGHTQQQLADSSGVPRPTLAHLESGDGNPTLSVLMRVAGALGVTLEQLVETESGRVVMRPVESLATQHRGQATTRQVYEDRSGSTFERIELPARGRCPVGVKAPATQSVVVCEAGRVEIRVDSEVLRLRAGDVVHFRGEVSGSCENPGARLAVLYLLGVPLLAGG
jgi:XRE family transcriptional regulator, regulator of sulfur utilization